MTNITFKFHGKKVGHKLNPDIHYEAQMLRSRTSRQSRHNMTIETRLPYYAFHEDNYSLHLEARFWNQSGKQLAIIACITKGVDWAAYIGTDAPTSFDEDGTLKYVAEHGCKLSYSDAKHFFPDIDLPYRN